MIKISLILFFLLLLPSCFPPKKIVGNQLIQNQDVIPTVILEEKDPKKLNALPVSSETQPLKPFVDTVQDLPNTKVNTNISTTQQQLPINNIDKSVASNSNKNITGSVIDDDIKRSNNITSFSRSTPSNTTVNSVLPSNTVIPVVIVQQPVTPLPVTTAIPTNTDKSKLVGKIG